MLSSPSQLGSRFPERQNTRLFFAFQLGMPSRDHASGALSRKAKRLDSVARHGRLPHAMVKGFVLSAASFLFSQFFLDGLLGLDIEGLSGARCAPTSSAWRHAVPLGPPSSPC